MPPTQYTQHVEGSSSQYPTCIYIYIYIYIASADGVKFIVERTGLVDPSSNPQDEAVSIFLSVSTFSTFMKLNALSSAMSKMLGDWSLILGMATNIRDGKL